MSFPLQISFPDGSHSKVMIHRDTTSWEVCRQILKKRKFNGLSEENIVLCISGDLSSGSSAIQKQAKSTYPVYPLSREDYPLLVYEEARSGGRLIEYAIKSKDELPQELIQLLRTSDGSSNSDQLSSSNPLLFSMTLKKLPASLIQGNACEDPEVVGEYTTIWKGKASIFGYMHKMGSLNTAWKRRFFVLQGSQLSYFRNHTDRKPLKKIEVEECAVREFPAKHQSAENFRFQVVSPTRVYDIRANSRAEMVKWIVKIHKHSRQAAAENRIFDELQRKIEDTEKVKSSARESIRKRLLSIHSVLEDKRCSEYFIQFLEQKRSEDNMFFIRSVKDFKESANLDVKFLRKKAELIYKEYLRPGSRNEISINDTLRKELVSELKKSNFDISLFDEILNKVISELEATSFQDFLSSTILRTAESNLPLSGLNFNANSFSKPATVDDIELRNILCAHSSMDGDLYLTMDDFSEETKQM